MGSGQERRSAMDAALKAVLAPRLRGIGFRGSLPNFRRVLEDRIDVLSIQHSRDSGAFCVEVGCCGPAGVEPWPGKHVPPEKVTTPYLRFGRDRVRLTPTGDGDHWFEYGPVYWAPEKRNDNEYYERRALDVWALVEHRGIGFWEVWRHGDERR